MITHELEMTTTEEKPITLQVKDLQEGEAVASATATHTPPSGSPIDIEITIDSPYVNMMFGPFNVPGHHFVDVQATGDASTPSKPVARYFIRVR
jgi:hypothetical protein